MYHTRLTVGHSVPGTALLALLGLWLSGAASVQGQNAIPERIVWHKEPILLVLTVGNERRVDFPGPVEVGVPPQLEAAVRVQSVAGTVCLLAHRAFDATRVLVRENENGWMYLLDLTAEEQGGSGG